MFKIDKNMQPKNLLTELFLLKFHKFITKALVLHIIQAIFAELYVY